MAIRKDGQVDTVYSHFDWHSSLEQFTLSKNKVEVPAERVPCLSECETRRAVQPSESMRIVIAERLLR